MKNNFYKSGSIQSEAGQLLLEILVVVALLAVIGAVIAQMIVVSMRANKLSLEAGAANGLIDETVSALESVAFEKWQNIYNLTKASADYYPSKSSGSWSIATGTETVTLSGVAYIRYFNIYNVCRDSATKGIIATSSPPYAEGTGEDPSTQKININLSWPSGSISKNVYIARWRNIICNQTSWTGTGSGTSTCGTATYESASNIDNSGTPGSLKLETN